MLHASRPLRGLRQASAWRACSVASVALWLVTQPARAPTSLRAFRVVRRLDQELGHGDSLGTVLQTAILPPPVKAAALLRVQRNHWVHGCGSSRRQPCR